MSQLLNTNQFAQVPVRGFVDWHIQRSGVLSGQISLNQVDPLKAGDPVKLDPAAVSNIAQFIKADPTDPLAFFLVFDLKKATFAPGDACEAAGLFGPVQWMTAEATVAMGAVVEQNADGNVQTLAAGKARGLALLNGTAGNLVPVMILTPVTPLS